MTWRGSMPKAERDGATAGSGLRSGWYGPGADAPS